LPTWRPDRALGIEATESFNAWVDALALAADTCIGSYDELLDALSIRHQAFHDAGCRLSDYGLTVLDTEECTLHRARQLFARARRRQRLSPHDGAEFRSALLLELVRMDHSRGWTQQLHLGAHRDVNTRMFAHLGPNTGFDAIGDDRLGPPLARFLDRLHQTDQLPKTIVYNLNPRDNEVVATILGCFQGGTPGKMQFGSAWWFLDQLDGMTRQLDALSNLGLLSTFVGMLTDSRSFLSYSRHEYFRRLLCNLLGNDVERGRLPRDLPLLGGLVERVAYRNARQYFGFPNTPRP
jgi:glucuronate isomerase